MDRDKTITIAIIIILVLLGYITNFVVNLWTITECGENQYITKEAKLLTEKDKYIPFAFLWKSGDIRCAYISQIKTIEVCINETVCYYEERLVYHNKSFVGGLE